MSDNVIESDTALPSESNTGMPVWLIPVLLIISIALGVAGEAIVGSVAAKRDIPEEGRYQRLYYPEPHGQLGDPPEWLIKVRNSMMANSAIGFAAFFGALLGVIGTVMGVAYSKPLRGLLIGIVAGLLTGGVVAPICYYIQWETMQIDMEGALKASLVLGLLFVALGIAGAFVALCAGPARSASSAIANGIFAAVAGLLAYILIAIAAFPIGFPEFVFPYDTGVRYTLYACLGICPAIAALLMTRAAKTSKPSEANAS